MFGYCVNEPDIAVECLDYKYIEKCKDSTKLQKILKVLRHGDEGYYPDLEAHTERVLKSLMPNSDLLEKKQKEVLTRDLPTDEKAVIYENIKVGDDEKENSQELSNGMCECPPIRPAASIKLNGTKMDHKSFSENSERDKGFCNMSNYDQLEPSEKIKAALREKNKGNEAFRSSDYEEALDYYNRSLAIHQDINVFNNRAITYIKLKKYKEAIEDATHVIDEDSTNLKAYLRRGIAFYSLKNLESAIENFSKVIEIDPKNKRGKDLYEKVNKEILSRQVNVKEKKSGKRLIIEEVDCSKEPINNNETNRNQDNTNETINKQVKSNDSFDNQTNDNRTVNNQANSKETISEQTSYDNTRGNPTNNQTHIKQTNDKETINHQTTNSKSNGNETNSKKAAQSVANPEIIDTLTREREDSSKHFSDFETSNIKNSKEGITDLNKTQDESEKDSLHADILKSVEKANNSFCRGAYDEARIEYIDVINKVEEENGSHEKILSDLYCKQAECEMKIGHCRESIQTSTRSLNLSKSSQAYLCRAFAYETLEKFGEAYVNFKEVVSLSPSTNAAIQGMSRLSSLLRKLNGEKWRTMLPEDKTESVNRCFNRQTTKQINEEKEDKVNVSEASIKSQQTSIKLLTDSSNKPTNSKQENNTDNKKFDRNEENSPSNNFLSLKEDGRQYVLKGNYSEAVSVYSKCIELMPDEVSSYTNRALCYLKCNEFDKASEDCSKALTLQPENVKALFRRAQAAKSLKQYRNALVDFNSVLKLEPNNKAAQAESTHCKELFRKELLEIQEKSAKEKARKIHIEEVQNNNVSKPLKNKLSTKAETCPLAKHTQARSSAKTKCITSEEFLKVMDEKTSSTKSCWEILNRAEPQALPELLGDNLSETCLKNIVTTISEHFMKPENYRQGLLFFKYLCLSKRFTEIRQKLTKKDQRLLRQTCSKFDALISKDNKQRETYDSIRGAVF